MFKNFINSTIHNFQKNRINVFITLFGLTIGIACTIVIAIWAKYEMSYDRFHDYSEDLYKAAFCADAVDYHAFILPAPVASHLKKEFPEVKDATVCWNWTNKKILQGENKFIVDGSFVDPSFFTMFSYLFIAGDSTSAFEHPNSIVLTESLSAKLFGSDDALGKTVKVDGEQEYIVSAVLKDIPANSDIQFDFLLPFSLVSEHLSSWDFKLLQVYVLLHKNVDYNEFNLQISSVLNEFKPDWNNRLYITPLTSCHLHDLNGGGRIQHVYILSVVALLILVIALFNTVNLTMASSDRRKKEIGVRKTFGSGKRLLITHFLLEAQIISFIAMAFALILVEWVLPTISNLLQVEMQLEYNLLTILLLIGFAFFTGFLSGIYPACYMSSINILDLIRKSQPKLFATKKGQKIQQSGTSKFKSGLVIFQFSVAMILMVGIIVISQQVQYIKQKDLGFEKDDVLVVNMHDELKHKYEVAKNKLMQMHEIASVSTSRSPLTSWELSDMPHWDGKPTELVFDMGINHVDYDFDETMGLELLSGRFLDKEFAKDATDGFVINEAAVKIMNMEEPIGKRLTFFEGTRSELDGEIIGVIKDMHTESLHTAIKPFAFAYKPSGSYMYIKLKSSANPEIAKSVISQLGKIAPTDPIQYTYLEDVLNDLYISEETTEKLIGYSSLIAIIISCLGLFGLSYYSLQKRIKEIGIRKVNGASVAQILILLNRDFMIWIVIAFVIATPVAWKVIGDWLAKFEYRIDLSWWIFAVVGLIAMMVAFVTISIQAYKVAVRNPVEALRYE